MLLETQNLAIGYEGKTLVQHIQFILEENQICCLAQMALAKARF